MNGERIRKRICFSEAKNDFKMGETLLDAQLYNGSDFHFQQAAEKVMKSLLSNHEVADKLMNAARALDRHYTASRYPDALPDLARRTYMTRT